MKKCFKVFFDWERDKAIDILESFGRYYEEYLEGLSNYELFNLGLKECVWSGKNPFNKEKEKEE
ncbi:MAG: hypothetical protein ACQERX_02165 [Bacillota bacterium]